MSDVARILKEARDQGRLTALDFAQGIFDDFIELHGDRNFRDDGAIIGGIGRLNGQAVTVVGIQKGKNLQDNLNRNFGQPHPEGYRKALRLMKQAEKFGRPVVTFINTAGAYPGVGAEERGQGEAIARNLMEMSDLKVPIIAIIIGEGGSGGAYGGSGGRQPCLCKLQCGSDWEEHLPRAGIRQYSQYQCRGDRKFHHGGRYCGSFAHQRDGNQKQRK